MGLKMGHRIKYAQQRTMINNDYFLCSTTLSLTHCRSTRTVKGNSFGMSVCILPKNNELRQHDVHSVVADAISASTTVHQSQILVFNIEFLSIYMAGTNQNTGSCLTSQTIFDSERMRNYSNWLMTHRYFFCYSHSIHANWHTLIDAVRWHKSYMQ